MSHPSVRVLTDTEEIVDARRLQARRYLEAGFVDRLGPDGLIDDEFVDISEWFGVTDDDATVGVSRLIPATPMGLPALTEFDLSDIGRRRVDAIPEHRMAEVSALAVDRHYGVAAGGEIARALYRAMYQWSLLQVGYTHWVAAIDVRVRHHLVRAHGFLFEDIGRSRMYLGSETVPVVLDLYAQMRHYATVDLRGGAYFSAGLAIDLTGSEPRLVHEASEHLPRREAIPKAR